MRTYTLSRFLCRHVTDGSLKLLRGKWLLEMPGIELWLHTYQQHNVSGAPT